MPRLSRIAAIGGILSTIPTVNAGFSAGSSSNVAVYWGTLWRDINLHFTDAFQVKTPTDKGQDLLLSNGCQHTVLVSSFNI